MAARGSVALAIVCALAFAGCSKDDEICTDGADNDSNGAADCEDGACGPGAACGPHGFVCASDRTCSACSGNGGPAEPTGEATCGDGVDNDCDGAVDCDDPTCQPTDSHAGRVCDSSGQTCTPPDAAGRSTCGAGGGGPTEARVGEIALAGAEHDVLGATGSGYREQSLLTFRVLTAAGAPFVGARVHFSHASQAGSYLGATPSCTPTTPSVCAAEAVTDAEGLAAVVLHSGRRHAVLSVRATVTAAGETREWVAGGFTVVGAKPSGARFSVDCRPYNVPALTTDDCLYSRYDGVASDVDCTATLGDRHGNAVAVPTLVSFLSEAGGMVPAAFTPAFHGIGGDTELGHAVGVLGVYGAPLPWDVAPFPGEVSYAIDYGCGMRTTNPRDGLVTVVALAAGEEGFVDLDLDGVRDGDEPFIDLPEPFVDVDDDRVRDEEEWYLDANENGVHDGPNGAWDADTVLWAQGRVLYTDYPFAARNAAGNELFARLYGAGAPPAPTIPVPPFAVFAGPPPTTEWYQVFFTDEHLNPLGPLTTFSADAVAGNVTASLSPPSGTADSLGTTFRQLYCADADAPGTCRDGPADQACTTVPCYLRTEVGSAFTYGNFATLSITCVQPGHDVVLVSATIEGVTWQMAISGDCLP